MREIIALSRWREHIPYTIPLTVLGALVAASNGAPIDFRILFVIAANVITVSYAFMINDIEDAEDDALDPKKAQRNPVSSGRISTEDAYTVVRILAVLAVFLYAFTNRITLGIGISTLLLSHLYSWKKVRLKAYPAVDIVSHSLMLSGLLLLSGFSTFSTQFKEIWLLTATAVMFSVYGQLYNQLRDYSADSRARLRNTTLLVGKRRAEILMRASIVLSVVSLLTAVYYNTFPYWLLGAVLVSSPFVFSLKTENDTSGHAAINVSGKLQTQLLLVFNIFVFLWVVGMFFAAI